MKNKSEAGESENNWMYTLHSKSESPTSANSLSENKVRLAAD